MSDIEVVWQSRLRELNLAEARFLWQPGVGPVRRNYAFGGRVYKIRLPEIRAESEHPEGDLSTEYNLVRRCAGMRTIPAAVEYRRTDNAEVAVYRQVEARPLSEHRLNLAQSLGVIVKVAGAALRLSWRGIAHNDLMPRNVLVSDRGEVFLIDFDQATEGTRWTAFYRNFLRGRADVGFYGSLRSLLDEQLRRCLPSPFSEVYVGIVDRRRLHEQWMRRAERGLEEANLRHAARCAVSAIGYRPLRRDGWCMLYRVWRLFRENGGRRARGGESSRVESRNFGNDAAA